MAVCSTASGFSYAWIAGSSGLQAQAVGQVLDAVAGMKRDQANQLLKAILAVADQKAEGEAPAQIEFPDIYDLDTGKPKPAYVASCERARDHLARLGVPFR
jgi:hypothetical protein